MTREEADAALADLKKDYWVVHERELYLKQGFASQWANRFYAHKDVAGTICWMMDSTQVKKSEYRALGEFSGDPVPPAKDYYEEDPS